MDLTKFYDHYSLRARLQPALFTLLPIAFAVFAWTKPGERWVTALWTLLGTGGFTYFLGIYARNQGKQTEPDLWKSWGGGPSTQMLRHSGSANSLLRERWHKYLGKQLDKQFPTSEEEVAAPKVADEIYEAGVKWLIGKTRDQKKFPLLYKENVHYGYCRNLYGMKGLGITLSLLGCLVSASAGAWYMRQETPQIAPWACTIASAMFLFWWVFAVKAEWVRVPAQAYADRLFESIETLSKAKTIKTDKEPVAQ